MTDPRIKPEWDDAKIRRERDQALRYAEAAEKDPRLGSKNGIARALDYADRCKAELNMRRLSK